MEGHGGGLEDATPKCIFLTTSLPWFFAQVTDGLRCCYGVATVLLWCYHGATPLCIAQLTDLTQLAKMIRRPSGTAPFFMTPPLRNAQPEVLQHVAKNSCSSLLHCQVQGRKARTRSGEVSPHPMGKGKG